MPVAVVIGASADRNKFGNKAVRAFRDKGFTVYPVHPTAKEIEGLGAYRSVLAVPAGPIDVVTVYLNPTVGLTALDDIARRKPREVWFNPGAESAEILAKAKTLGLNTIAACSIVGYNMSPAAY